MVAFAGRALAIFVACAALSAFSQPAAPPAAVELKALLDEQFDATLRNYPFIATIRGIPGYNDLLPDRSLATLEKERARQREALARLKRVDAGALQGQDRISYELLMDRLRWDVVRQRYTDADALVISSLGGVQDMMPRAAQTTPFRTAADYRDYARRLSAMPKLVDDTIARLRVGVRSGWMAGAAVVDRVVAAIDAHLVENADESTLMGPFKAFAAAVPQDEREALRARGRRAIADDYQPALRRYKAFLLGEYRPKAPRSVALAALPGGTDFYEFLIRSDIVEGQTAAQIHELGLREVARIRGEIGAIAHETGFAGSTDRFIHAMQTDPRFFFPSAQAMLAAFREVSHRVAPQLPKLFHAVPRMPYEVRGMTPAEAASSTAANYMPGSLKLGTPAFITIDAVGYRTEPTWQTETLFAHEGVPGHHMQIARASEVAGLHPWRAMGGSNVAYSEGWALYAETLGPELGLYKDPYQHYGNLQSQLFRAARLVVDTGIHRYNWPRQKAIDYMAQQGGVEHAFAVSEVDRYFSNPSQALGYMIGERKFLELRARAQAALGARFDVRDFHAVAIDNGRMPLAVLEKLVDEWIASSAADASPGHAH